MQRVIIFLFVLSATLANAQIKIGVKAGINFANVTNASGIKADTRTGYLVGGYITAKPKKILGFRSEIILSRQGYDYKTSTNTGNVNLDYLLLPQLITVNFTKLVQIHVGGQAAFLLNANVDSTGSGNGSLFEYFNRFDYGVVAGGEIYPLKGLFFGARINISLNDISVGGNRPNYIPDVNAKNNVVQLYAGLRL